MIIPRVSRFLVDSKIKGLKNVHRLLARHSGTPRTFLESGQHPAEVLKKLGEPPSKSIFSLAGSHGRHFKECQGMTDKTLCCGLRILDQAENCPFNCSYCFLQSYLTETITTLFMDTGALLREAHAAFQAEPRRLFRVGTGELSDSVAFERMTGFAEEAVPFFADRPNAVLELKTKSRAVEPLLNLRHGGRTVVSWSVNPQKVIDVEEPGTATLKERLDAARQVTKAGYLTGFHFDPIIDGREGYADVVERIFNAVEPNRVAWISLGTLRFAPSMKTAVMERHPRSKIMLGELVNGFDGKTRYPKPLRLKLYSAVAAAIRKRAPNVFVYLCMETPEVWRKVLGFSPASSAELDGLFTERLRRTLAESPYFS